MNYTDYNSRRGVLAHTMGDIPARDDPLATTIREAIIAMRRAEFEAEYQAALTDMVATGIGVVEHSLPDGEFHARRLRVVK